MSVFIDGSTLSSLLYSHANSEGNQEGVLLGQVVKQVKEHISDSQINNSQLHTFTYVASHIPWPSEHRVYSRGGVPIMEKVAALLGDSHTQEEVVGWYSFRRNSTLRMSMKERTLHKHLEARFCPDQPQQFVFLMCVHSCSAHLSTHSVDHFFATLTPNAGMVKKMVMSVTNLGDTVHTQYKTLAHSAATQSTAVQNILHSVRSQFVSSAGDMQEVQKINDMSKALNNNLLRLCQQVADSEQQAGELEREVVRLKEELAERAERSRKERQKEKDEEKKREEGEMVTNTGYLYPTLPIGTEAEVEKREETEAVEVGGARLEQVQQPPPCMPSIDELLSMPPTTSPHPTSPNPTPDLSGLQPVPASSLDAPPPPPSAPGGAVLQSVMDTITDTDEEEHVARVSQHHPPSSTLLQGTSHQRQGQVKSAEGKNRAAATGLVHRKTTSESSGLHQTKMSGALGTGAKHSTSLSESSSKGKDHFSFVDNLLSSESGSSHRKTTATVPTGVTLTYNPRTTRSQIKVVSNPASTSCTKDRAKARNSPTRSALSQPKRDGSPKVDGKVKATSGSRVGGLSTQADRRRGKVESSPVHDRGNQSVPSNRDAQAIKAAHSSRQDTHTRVKLDPASCDLGGRCKNRSKVVSTVHISKNDSDGEKVDSGPEDKAKNGTVGCGEQAEEVPRSLSPVF